MAMNLLYGDTLPAESSGIYLGKWNSASIDDKTKVRMHEKEKNINLHPGIEI